MQLLSHHSAAQLKVHHPEAGEELRRLEILLDQSSLDDGLLALCRRYFETELRHQPWDPPASPTPLEAACLEFCEQFRVSVDTMSDAQVQALLAHLSADDVYNLASAVYLLELSCRLDLTLEAVLP
ncbi:MAG: hypothetical protein AAGA23_02985 [Pseudomonadota bacterium]